MESAFCSTVSHENGGCEPPVNHAHGRHLDSLGEVLARTDRTPEDVAAVVAWLSKA